MSRRGTSHRLGGNLSASDYHALDDHVAAVPRRDWSLRRVGMRTFGELMILVCRRMDAQACVAIVRVESDVTSTHAMLA